LLRPIGTWLGRLADTIERGDTKLAPEPKRADAIRRIWRGAGSDSEKLSATWPNLQLISCWADAGAAVHVPALREAFPKVEIQSKGLIATEAFVSLPLFSYDGAALAIRSHFFEFEEISTTGRCRLAHEIERGGRYRVIVTTAGGLYRYQLRDEIE